MAAASELPAGRAARLLPVGSYLNEPSPDGYPNANQALITWPIA